MRLVANLDTMLMSPRHPLLGEILEQQVAQCLAIVSEHLIAIIYCAQQFWKFCPEVVAATLLEFIEQRWCPVGFIHLITVVEERVRVGYPRFCKSSLETVEIMTDGLAVEMVHHPAFTARSSTLDLLFGAADFDSIFKYGLAGGLFQ